MSRGDVLADTLIALCPGHGIDMAQSRCLISLLSTNGCLRSFLCLLVLGKYLSSLSMVGRIMSPAQDVYEIISKICEYAGLHGKGTLQID